MWILEFWHVTAIYDYCVLNISKMTELCRELCFSIIIHVWFIILFFLLFPVIMCIFYLCKIYLQIINGYYKCIFISLCDCVNHQSDLWSGYWNKAVGLWLGNCKNWIRRFWACESKKKKENTNKPAIQGPQWSCVCYQWSASEVGDTVALYSGTVASVYDE